MGEFEPRFGHHRFFTKQSHGRESWGGIGRMRSRTRAVRNHTNQARGRFCLVWVLVGALRRDRPRHQGQTEPSRPFHPQTHDFPALDLDSSKLITVIWSTATFDKLL